MATNPNQTPEDLTTPSPHVPTRAEVRITELRSRLRQPNRGGGAPPPPPRRDTTMTQNSDSGDAGRRRGTYNRRAG
jgi:hypothetical protein